MPHSKTSCYSKWTEMPEISDVLLITAVVAT